MDFVKSHEAVLDLVKKAQNDVSFKETFINNPKEVLETKFDKEITLPEGVRIEVVDQSDSDYIFLNIPRRVDVDDLQLTDADLEKISGGDGSVISCVVGAIVVGALIYGAGYLVGRLTN